MRKKRENVFLYFCTRSSSYGLCVQLRIFIKLLFVSVVFENCMLELYMSSAMLVIQLLIPSSIILVPASTGFGSSAQAGCVSSRVRVISSSVYCFVFILYYSSLCMFQVVVCVTYSVQGIDAPIVGLFQYPSSFC